MKLPPLLTAIFLSCCLAAPAQPEKQYTVTRYSTENGLLSNGIKGLQWDESTGFLWIATEAGIARFNGLEFRTYTISNTDFIGAERIAFLARNNRGKLFAADEAGNVFTIRENRIELFKRANEADKYRDFLLTVSDQLYASALHRKPRRIYAIPYDVVVPISDSLALIRGAGRIFYYSLSTEHPIKFTGFEGPAAQFFHTRKSLIIGSKEDRFFRANPADSSIEELPFLNPDGSRFAFRKGNYRIYWENGISYPILFQGSEAYIIREHDNRLIAENICNKVPDDAYIRFAQYSEKQGMLFLGTDSKGITVIKANSIYPMKAKNRKINERNAYYAQIELPNGNILTNESHVVGNDSTTIQLPITGRFLHSIHRTDDSLLWYGQTEPSTSITTLFVLNEKNSQIKKYGKVRVNEQLAVTRTGGELYFVDGKGIAVMRADSLQYRLTFSTRNRVNTVYEVVEKEPGILLIASCQGLLEYSTVTNRLTVLLNLQGYCIRSIWKYGDYYFLGSYGKGYFIMKDGKIKAMPLDKSGHLQYAHCFVPDEEGYCWISTNRGLFQASIAALIEAFEKDIPSVYYHYYGRNDGMDITELNGGCKPCALTLRNRMISFPSMDGLLWVDTRRSKPNFISNKIYIDEFIADNRKIDLVGSENIELPSNVKNLVIRLGFAAWGNRENVYLDYRLSDKDEWTPVSLSDGAALQFYNLPSGEHQLTIRKLNGFGNNYSYETVKIRVETPWYLRPWFMVLALIGLVAIIYVIVRLRTSQYRRKQERLEKLVAEKTVELQAQNEVLEKNNKIKTRLISIISHDIITPLKFLTVAGKNLMEKRSMMPEELQQEAISEITNTSQELQLLSTNILNWIKYQNEQRRLVKETFTIHEIVESVFSVLQSLARQKSIELRNRTVEALTIHQFYEPLKILVYNLVSNAINFSDGGSIIIEAQGTGNMTVLTVSDQGMGMSKEQVHNLLSAEHVVSSTNQDNRKGHGLGYLIIKDLLKMMDAKIEIESSKGKGTKVRIIIPG